MYFTGQEDSKHFVPVSSMENIKKIMHSNDYYKWVQEIFSENTVYTVSVCICGKILIVYKNFTKVPVRQFLNCTFLWQDYCLSKNKTVSSWALLARLILGPQVA
jgi:hypothetical protein